MATFTTIVKHALNWTAGPAAQNRRYLDIGGYNLLISVGFKLIIGGRQDQSWTKPSRAALQFTAPLSTHTPTPTPWSNANKSR